MLHFAGWKKALVALICLGALIFSAPNLFYDAAERHNDAAQAVERGATDPETVAAYSAWPSWAPSSIVNLGLDLRGGTRYVFAFDFEKERELGNIGPNESPQEVIKQTIGIISSRADPDGVREPDIRQEGFDRVVVDGIVNFVGMMSQTFGAVSRLLQTGRVQQYAAFAVGGGLLTAAWLILS